MSYTVRVRDDRSWLDLLDEAGEVEEFSTFPWAVVRIKELFSGNNYTEAEIRHADGSTTRFVRGPGGEPQIAG